MSKPTVIDFVRFALLHVRPETVPAGAVFPVAANEIGIDPWHYLFGTVKAFCNAYVLKDRYDNYYSKQGYSEDYYYGDLTGDWKTTDIATDCNGLKDAFQTEQGTKTDINAEMSYQLCTDKGAISAIDRPWVIGEAVFREKKRSDGTKYMCHIGWICGFLNGAPLVVEAQGIKYGVRVNQLSKRNFTHRGLMTKEFDYTPIEEDNMSNNTNENNTTSEPPAVFKLKSRGDDVRALQHFLNAIGYRDENGFDLSEDGILGAKTMFALTKFLEAHRDLIAALPVAFALMIGGKTVAEGEA